MSYWLEETEKGGNAKIKQINDWLRYFDYDKHKTKFVIKKKYKEPKPQTQKPRNIKYINLTWFLLNTLLDKHGETTKTNLMRTIGFVTNDFFKEANKKGFDDQAVSFVYDKIDSKFKGNIKSFVKNGMIYFNQVLCGIEKGTEEVIELTPQEILKYNELDSQVIKDIFESEGYCVPLSNPIGILSKMQKRQAHKDNLAKLVKKETEYKRIFKALKYEISDSDFTYDTSEAEDIINNSGSIEAVKQELNRRINQSIYEALEKKNNTENGFDSNTTEEIIKLIHLNDLNAACNFENINNTISLDDFDDDLNYDNDEPEEDTPVLYNNQKSKDWNVHDCQKMPDGSNWYDD